MSALIQTTGATRTKTCLQTLVLLLQPRELSITTLNTFALERFLYKQMLGESLEA